jgi:hypothetical protein
MIAEINRKGKKGIIDSEDELTGNFFGNLRYLPFNKGLKYILNNTIFPEKLRKTLDRIGAEEWSENIEFWRTMGGSEPDVLVTFSSAVILIEVKYNSDLSSPDQLVKYGELLSGLAGYKKRFLILLAREENARKIYYETVESKKLIHISDVSFGYMTWQSVFDELTKLLSNGDLNQFERVIICDLVNLLRTKGFERFRNFEISVLVLDIGNKWIFDSSTTDTSTFSFNINQKVERGLFYEFGREYSQCI